MKITYAIPAVLASGVLAFPGMASMKEEVRANVKREARPQVLKGVLGTDPNLLGGLGKTLAGLPESLAQNVNLDNRRPEPGFEFQEPGPGDSRGPCPGLNLLANYGYLPRNGYVNLGQVQAAASRGFNMHYDLTTVLGVFAVLANGNITTQSWWLGADPNGVGGLNRHSTVEADVSPNREDFYNGCGDNHHLSSRMVKRLINIMNDDPSKTVNKDVITKHYSAQASFAKANNPYLYYFPFPLIVSLGAYAFYPNFFSNGTYGAGGVPNWESVASIIGAQYDAETDEIMYVPERWPENWYRRATPYGAVTTIADIISIYAANPIVPTYGGLLTENSSPETILCAVYQGLNSVTPLELSDDAAGAEAAVTWAISTLDNHFDRTILGCPGDAISKNPDTPLLYPNPDQEGGPLKRPAHQDKWVGNNVYYKTYFTEAPVQPACEH